MRRLWRCSAAALLATCAYGGSAFAFDKLTCAAAYENAQQFRHQLKLQKAREQLLICSHSTCPAVVSSDCGGWLKEVDAAIPSVNVRLRDERGRSIPLNKLWVNGEFWLGELDGSPIPLDPGLHTLRVEADGFASAESKVLLRSGDRGSLVEMTMAPVASEPPPLPSDAVRDPVRESLGERAVPEGSAPSKPAPESPMRVAAVDKVPVTMMYVAGGVGMAALASFGYFAVAGTNQAKDLRQSCAPMCAKDDVDAARTKLVAANISLGVGLGAAAVAGVLWLTRSSTPASSNSWSLIGLDVRPSPVGSGAQVLTTFSAP